MHDEEIKLADVAPEETFKSHNGKEIKNLHQLLDVLNDISPDSFTHHVNKDKNDFARWIRHSVKDDELADAMEKTIDFEETKHIVNDRIAALQNNMDVKKLKEHIDSLKPGDIGLDNVPDHPAKLEMPDQPDKAKEIPTETHPSELQQANPHTNTPLTTEEQEQQSSAGVDHHPFEHVKRSLHLTIRDFMVGLLIGLIIGYIIGAFML